MMDAELSNKIWLVGNKATLADIACYSYLAVAHEGKLDLSPFQNNNQWLTEMRGRTGFVEMIFTKQ